MVIVSEFTESSLIGERTRISFKVGMIFVVDTCGGCEAFLVDGEVVFGEGNILEYRGAFAVVSSTLVGEKNFCPISR